MRVLTWNLFHGRSVPDAPRSLLGDFAEQLAAWEWDVALLQEVPPWWPPALGRASRAGARTALTSRNWLRPVSRWAAQRRPDLVKSWGGGANAILVRGLPILDSRAARLRWLPERRWVHGVLLAEGWVVNVHAQNRPEAAAQADCERALSVARGWGPLLVFGGDLNLRAPRFEGLRHVAGNHVDHLFTTGRAAGPPEVLDRGRLSDHPPVAVTLA